MPTLVIHGDSDAIVPFEVRGKLAAELVDDATLVVLEDAPHGFNLSHADQFNAALLDFLAKESIERRCSDRAQGGSHCDCRCDAER